MANVVVAIVIYYCCAHALPGATAAASRSTVAVMHNKVAVVAIGNGSTTLLLSDHRCLAIIKDRITKNLTSLVIKR
ncbi:hypothetical protein GW17_00061727 [Ensete ventricosum]|uniref:Uncharacterized protein n=1 Tax=Ensete ventricosum TaxID=4639 RepID=A0A426YTW0_ENSVE|nr:hypothetical protein B296_00030009 [Ensete ventricosum]RWV77446.1 hypothetical protein GW17_00061727 [Ensete ventricosum]